MTVQTAGSPDDQVLAAIRDLCEWIEDVATKWQDVEMLARLLDLIAQVLYLAEDYRLAARHWMRALEINRAHAADLPHAHADRVSMLESLSRLYHQTRRPLKAIEAELELVSLHQAVNPTAFTAQARAQALAQVGSTMITASQYDDARDYLIQADQAFQALDITTPQLACAHGRVLELLAAAHRHQGRPADARRCEDRATEVAAVPLVPVASMIGELENTLTLMVDQVTALDQQVAAVADAIGGDDQPTPAGLAKVPDVVAAWYELASSIDDLRYHLKAQIRVIAGVAGKEITGGRKRTVLDAVFELSDWVAYSARKRGESAPLIEVLDRSARIFFMAKHDRFADTQWARALQHADEITCGAPGGAAAAAGATAIRILEARSDLCHGLNRLNEAIDVETDLINRHRYADDRPATARALARLGSTLVAANRPDRAEVYLTEADGMFQALDDPAMATSHVSTLELLATVFNHGGRSAEAMQCEQRVHELRAAIPYPAGQNVNSTSC